MSLGNCFVKNIIKPCFFDPETCLLLLLNWSGALLAVQFELTFETRNNTCFFSASLKVGVGVGEGYIMSPSVHHPPSVAVLVQCFQQLCFDGI